MNLAELLHSTIRINTKEKRGGYGVEKRKREMQVQREIRSDLQT